MDLHRFPCRWNLGGIKFRKDRGTVFSCFAGVGGSTMGYKLAGFNVIGMNEVDEKMAKCYIINHRPKYGYVEPIQEFKNRKDLPDELYDLSVLDGSPPCSSFSMAGKREKGWGRKKKFREGQIEQVLDTLFFDFIELARRIQPKVAVAENVPAILLGSAIRYAQRIYAEFNAAGYYLQHFVLDASRMGVPQRRRRVFFIALRKDLSGEFLVNDGLLRMKPDLKLSWDEPKIRFGQVRSGNGRERMPDGLRSLLRQRVRSDESIGDINMRLYGKPRGFNVPIVRDHLVCPVPTTVGWRPIRDCDGLQMSDEDFINIFTFPSDFDFCGIDPHYACGMSVPPVMMAHVAFEIHRQWLSKIK